jgi:hypothetical protein
MRYVIQIKTLAVRHIGGIIINIRELWMFPSIVHECFCRLFLIARPRSDKVEVHNCR